MTKLVARIVINLAASMIDDTVPEAELRALIRKNESSLLAPDPISKQEAELWVKQLPEGRAISTEGIRAGAGRFLDFIDETDAAQHGALVVDNAERLMRHVEIKRKRSLREFVPKCDAEHEWLERHDIAVFFVHYAQRHGDLRLLNAAFKLNDWAFPQHCTAPPSRRLSRYLWALAEQEKAAKELLT